MVQQLIKGPLVLREVGDPELLYFASLDDVLSDRFDCLWGDNYEGWDARGFFFKVERRYPEIRWWQRLLNLDVSYLEIVSVEQSRIDIRRVLAQDLGIVDESTKQECLSIAQLIQLALDRE